MLIIYCIKLLFRFHFLSSYKSVYQFFKAMNHFSSKNSKLNVRQRNASSYFIYLECYSLLSNIVLSSQTLPTSLPWNSTNFTYLVRMELSAHISFSVLFFFFTETFRYCVCYYNVTEFICASTLLFVCFVVIDIVVFWKTASMTPSLVVFFFFHLSVSFSDYIPEPWSRGLIKTSHLGLSVLKSLIVGLFSSLSLG